jgi:predicted ATPase/DNA-binding SARP family transcriptional activator
VGKTTSSQRSSRNTFRANLPELLTSFIGRERELADVTDSLARTRLLTLIGAGGCGKTRLALQLAKDTADAFPDGVWAVELAPLGDPVLLPQSVALALGVQEAPRQSLTETLSNHLKLKHLLLVLDNCEHLRTAIARLAQTLLLAAPDLKILATSREALALAGEATYLVPSLSLPEPQDQSSAGMASLAELRRYDAPALFIERAKVVSFNFSVTPQNAAAIVRVCRRLDGVPLAIELAAARARVLTVEQIAARLDDRFNLLTSDNPAVVIPRHQTLRAAIDWSYDSLSAQERKLFRRLSVFAGGFTIEAAEAICADETLAPRQILDQITKLVDKSMLMADVTEREARYRLLETMREYAREKLMEASELDTLPKLHLDYFVQFAERAEPKLRSGEQVVWLKRVETEYDNLRAALQWAHASRDRDAALRLVGAMFWYWYLRASWSEGRNWLQDALSVDERDRSQTIQALERNDPASRVALAQRARALYGAGILRFGETTVRGVPYSTLEESLQLWRLLEDKWWIAVVLKELGYFSMMKGDIPTARAQFEESVALAQEVEDKWPLAVALTRLGTTLSRVDPVAARPVLEKGVAAARAVGDKSILAYALNSMAGLLYLQGDDRTAVRFAEESVSAAREIGSKLEVGLSLNVVGMTLLTVDDPVKAAGAFAEALSLGQESGTKVQIAQALGGLGGVAGAIGSPIQAAHLLAAAELMLQRIGIDVVAWGGETALAYSRYMQLARSQLDEATFTAALQEGRGLTPEQAIEEAQSVAAQVQKKTESPVSESESMPRADLTISAFGASQVYRGEQLLTSADWTYAKSRELLYYLLSYAARTKEQIGLDLWPDVSPAQLRNTLGVRLHHLRRALGRADWIVFENNTYAFNRSLNYWFDVEAFETYLANARRVREHSPEQAIRHFQDAVKLYRGDFVQDWVDGEWFVARRAELREKYLDALLTLGQLLFAETNYAQAAATYRQVIEHDNYVEAAHRELMRCCARLGEPGQALRHYQELVKLMRDELGSPPAPETTELFQRLRRGEEV